MASEDRVLLDLVGELQGMLDVSELVDGMLTVLQRVVPSDYVSINDVGPDPEGTVAVIVPPQPRELHDAYARHAQENPLTIRLRKTRDGRPYRFSDVITRTALRKTALYREIYAPLGVEHQMAFTLPSSPERVLGVALSRRARDYTDSERDLVLHARPFLIQAWRNAIEHTTLRDRLANGVGAAAAPTHELTELGLTARQCEVLWLVACGRSNQDAAESLGLSVRTVQKHLQRCYRTLRVSSRSQAARLAWSLAERAPVARDPRRLKRA
jgi:DNA-binding NarL/FixJ family response regulator